MVVNVANTFFEIKNGGKVIEDMFLPFISSGKVEHTIILKEKDSTEEKRSQIAKEMTFYLIANKNTIRMHGSCVDFNGKAIMFLAPSGTGKSTHAKLWNKYAKAEYINDDQPYVNVDSLLVYGSPIAGKHKRFSTKVSPLCALVFISQSKSNSIIKLDKLQAVKSLYKQMIHYEDLSDREKQLESLDKLTNLPTFILQCDKSKEAFLTCYKGVFEKEYEG